MKGSKTQMTPTKKRDCFDSLRYEFFPLEDEATTQAFAMLDPSLASEAQLISGREKDFKSGRRFIKTKFNREGGGNYRSPYSTTMWPANERCYPSQRVQRFEEIMNEKLREYISQIYGARAIGNAYMEEVNDFETKVGVALVEMDTKNTSKTESMFLYKLVGEMEYKQGNPTNKSVSINFGIRSRNQYIFWADFRGCREKMLFFGNSAVKR